MITRRDTTRLLLASVACAALPGSLFAATAEEWQAALEKALVAAMVPGSETRLSLAAFDFGKKGKDTGMVAVVRMDWAPGYRSRRFVATETGEQETFKRLVTRIVDEFRRANPDGVREVKFS